MRFFQMVLVPVLVLAAVGGLNAQSEPPTPAPVNQQEKASPCPQMQIQSQARTVKEGQPVSFTARISGGDRNITPSILWNISAGSIRDGQGTTRIDVDTTGAGQYRVIDAELWIGGYAPECTAQSPPFRVTIIPPAAKFDEFGSLTVEEETKKIDLAVKALQYGNDRLYVVGYAGRTSERLYTNTSLRRMRDQILRSGLPANRVSAYDGGFRETPAFELWIVPEGAEPPRPSPTIDRKDIVFPRTTRTTRPAPARKP